MKKNFTLSILIFLTLCASSYAQKTAAKTEIWEEFTATDKSFKILFPKQTEKEKEATQQVKNLSKMADTDKIIFTETASYSVMFSDYPAAPVDEMERNARYEERLVKLSPKTKNVYVQKNPGVETVTEINKDGMIADSYFRLFIVRQRLFVLSVAVPSLKKLSPVQCKIYQAKIDKFFNSFTVLEIPPAKYEPTPLLPKDFKISLNGQMFQSEKLNLSIQIPADWTAKLHDPNTKPDPALEKENIMLRWLWRNKDGLMGIQSPTKEGGLGININRREFAGVTTQKFAEDMAGFLGFSFSSNTNPPLSVKPLTINGREFFMFEQTDDGMQKGYYFADLGEWILEIRTQYKQESDKKLIEDALNTLKFSK
jgi:hypothetical protein